MKISAGILLYRNTGPQTEYFLVHPGGPFFAKKDAGWWTVPKGELLPGEDPLTCAQREFEEETGYRPQPPFTELQPITQKGGKKVLCWAAEGDLDHLSFTCNTFEMEWPPKTGRKITCPEIDKPGWFAYDEALRLINEMQRGFIEEFVLSKSKKP